MLYHGVDCYPFGFAALRSRTWSFLASQTFDAVTTPPQCPIPKVRRTLRRRRVVVKRSFGEWRRFCKEAQCNAQKIANMGCKHAAIKCLAGAPPLERLSMRRQVRAVVIEYFARRIKLTGTPIPRDSTPSPCYIFDGYRKSSRRGDVVVRV